MDYAVIAPVAAGVTADPDWMTSLAQHVEASGFESLVVVEHTVLVTEYASTYPYDPSGRVGLAPDCPVPDPLDLLAFLAGRTATLKLATGVLVLPNHQPVVLAKRAASLSALSQGRLRLCVGVGWLREELEACDVPFQARGRRADEQLQVMRALWEGGPDGVSHHGEFFNFDHVTCFPKPVGELSVHVGGHSVAAARRAGRYAQGFQPLGVTPDRLRELVAAMRDAATEADRDPDALELSLGHLVTKIDPARADNLAALGASRIVLDLPPTDNLDEACSAISACAQRLGIGS